MPLSIKNQIKTARIIGFCLLACTVVFLAILWGTDCFQDQFTGVTFSLMLLLIVIPSTIPPFLFDKISQSTVNLSDDNIHICDKKGICWRTISFDNITKVDICDISGFFYGQNSDKFCNKYICLFLNGETDMPDVPFAKLFSHNNFMMFAYHEDAEDWFLGQGDGSVCER